MATTRDPSLPGRDECLALMERLAMPLNIRRHSVLVAEVATVLVQELLAQEMSMDLGLVEAAALLHDLGKARSLETGEDHARLGAEMLIGLGFPRLGPLVREHTLITEAQLGGGLDESLLVNYSDKRVKHDEVVSLSERLGDLADRYARSPRQRVLLAHFLGLYQRLEAKIFSRISFQPTELVKHLRPGVVIFHGIGQNFELEGGCPVKEGSD